MSRRGRFLLALYGPGSHSFTTPKSGGTVDKQQRTQVRRGWRTPDRTHSVRAWASPGLLSLAPATGEGTVQRIPEAQLHNRSSAASLPSLGCNFAQDHRTVLENTSICCTSPPRSLSATPTRTAAFALPIDICDIVHSARRRRMRLCAGLQQPSTLCMPSGEPQITQQTSAKEAS
jgi:hypothetical protein